MSNTVTKHTDFVTDEKEKNIICFKSKYKLKCYISCKYFI